MNDALADQDIEDAAPAQDPATEPAPAPAAPVADIEKVRTEYEERLKGFQRLVAEREASAKELQRQLEEARLSTLSDEEREEEIVRRRDEEIERLRAENELLRLGPEFADELPLYQQLLSAPDARAQLEILRQIRKAQAAAPAAPPSQAPASGAPAPVDPNNPPRADLEGVTLPDGTVLTEDLADRLLRSVPFLRR